MASSIARTALLGAAVLLVGLALVADAAPDRPTVGDLTRGWKPSAAKAGIASVSTAQQEGYESYNGDSSHGSGAGYYPSVEEKEVCLVETLRRNCEYLDDFYYIHGEYTSEITTCASQQASYKLNAGVGFGGANAQQSLSATGSCDWLVDFGYGWDLTYNIYRIGGASATCYFNGNGDESDAGPLAHRVVFGLQGYYYYVYEALSYQGGYASNWAGDSDCDYAIWGDGTYNRLAAKAGSTTTTDAAAGNSTAAKPTPPATTPGAPRRQRPAKPDRPQRAPKAHDGAQRGKRSHKPASAQVAQVGAGLQYHGADSTHSFSTDKPVYYGEAYVMNGIITTLAGQVKKEWQTGGTFEFTVDFYAFGLSNDDVDFGSTGVQAGLPWVTDKEYKLTFYKYADYYPSSQK